MESTKLIIKTITEQHNKKMDTNSIYKSAYENKPKTVKIMTF